MSAEPFDAVTLVPGAASGPILRLDEPLTSGAGSIRRREPSSIASTLSAAHASRAAS